MFLNGKQVDENFGAGASSPALEATPADSINHPAHYVNGRKYEPIAVIEDWGLGFALGNTVKYISRAGRKQSAALDDLDKEIQDLEKARWYLDRRIKELKESLCD